MTRLFLRFYLGVLLILIAAWFLQALVYRLSATDQNVRVVEQAMAGGLRLARDRLDQAEQIGEALEVVRQNNEYPVELLTIDKDRFNEQERKRLRQYDEIVYYSHQGARVATVLSNGRDVLSFGPLPSFVGPTQAAVLSAVAVILLLVACAIAILLRPVARQLREVETTAMAIAEGDLSARVDSSRVPRGQQLANAFNTMADRTEDLLITQREMLQAVSHELRTPLARMRFAIGLIPMAKTQQEQEERLRWLDSAAEDADQLVGELLSYVRMDQADLELSLRPTQVAEVAETVVEKLSTLHPSITIDIQPLTQQSPIIRVDSAALQRVLSNLIANACRFAKKHVKLSVVKLGDGFVRIDVDDDGPGIPVDDRKRVLEPFVRLGTGDSNDRRRGVGLGLALVNRIVTTHGGEVTIEDSPLGGCRVRTTWPE